MLVSLPPSIFDEMKTKLVKNSGAFLFTGKSKAALNVQIST
jgi:hypothetical protein